MWFGTEHAGVLNGGERYTTSHVVVGIIFDYSAIVLLYIHVDV